MSKTRGKTARTKTTPALRAASDPATPAAVLGQLGGSPDAETRRAVAGNRACPPGLLAELAADHDPAVREQVARRRAKLPATVAQILAGQHPVPAAQPRIRQLVAARRDCPAELVVQLSHDPDMQVVAAAVANRACPPARLAQVAQRYLAAQGVPAAGLAAADQTLSAVASNPACPPWLLAQIFDAPVAKKAQVQAVRHLACPPETLDKASRARRKTLYKYVALHPSTPPAALGRISQASTTVGVLCAVVAHPACPTDVLEELASNLSPRVRHGVAASPSCPLPVLHRLLRSKIPKIQQAAINNQNMPPHVRAMWQLVH
jgi:hypothetical protein